MTIPNNGVNGFDGRKRPSFNENKDQTSNSDKQKPESPPSFSKAAKKRLSGTGSMASDGNKFGAKQGTTQATQMDAVPRGGIVKPKSRPSSVRRVPGA